MKTAFFLTDENEKKEVTNSSDLTSTLEDMAELVSYKYNVFKKYNIKHFIFLKFILVLS